MYTTAELTRSVYDTQTCTWFALVTVYHHCLLQAVVWIITCVMSLSLLHHEDVIIYRVSYITASYFS
jgi:hypothetical protein